MIAFGHKKFEGRRLSFPIKSLDSLQTGFLARGKTSEMRSLLRFHFDKSENSERVPHQKVDLNPADSKMSFENFKAPGR